MYSFIAFSAVTGQSLSHDLIAARALQKADEIAPKHGIRVIRAGELGRTIWAQRLTLTGACKIVDLAGC